MSWCRRGVFLSSSGALEFIRFVVKISVADSDQVFLGYPDSNPKEVHIIIFSYHIVLFETQLRKKYLLMFNLEFNLLFKSEI